MTEDIDRTKIIAELEQKAESILERIGETKRPVFIEFCGTPKAGKTTALNSLDLFLRRNGFKVEIIRERASICPIPKKNHMHFNMWTATMTLGNMLALLDTTNDVVLIDRGIFDAMIWFFWMNDSGRLTGPEFETIKEFTCMDNWTSLVDIVFALTADYKTANDREFKDLMTRKAGSIMNERVITQYNTALGKARKQLANKFKHIVYVSSNKMTPATAGAKITRETLEILSDSLDEKILALPKNSIKELLGDDPFVGPEKAGQITSLVEKQGKYIVRSKVEESKTLIQLIPCGLIEYEGKLLLLRRSETDPNNRLHERYTIWAGGHIREQDAGATGDALTVGLKRELAEELFIKSQYSLGQCVGLVYVPNSIKAKRHLGVVYKIELKNSEVALGLDQTEFKERRGKSVSGTFRTPAELRKYYLGMEEWSQVILSELYGIKGKTSGQKELF